MNITKRTVTPGLTRCLSLIILFERDAGSSPARHWAPERHCLNKRSQHYQTYCHTGPACPELDSGTRCLSLIILFERDAGSSPAWHWAPEEHCHNKWKENPFSKRQTGAYNKHFPVSQVLSHRGLSWTWFRIDPVSFSNNFFRERCRIKSGMTSVFIISFSYGMTLGFVWYCLNKWNQHYQTYCHTGPGPGVFL